MRSRLGTKPEAVTIDLSHVDYMDSSGLAPLIEALLTGRLERLDEIDYGGGVRVEARLSAELTNLRTGIIAWTGSASEDLEDRPAKCELRRRRDEHCPAGQHPASDGKYAETGVQHRSHPTLADSASGFASANRLAEITPQGTRELVRSRFFGFTHILE